MEENNQEQGMEMNISSLWLKRIFMSLMRIEDLERDCSLSENDPSLSQEEIDKFAKMQFYRLRSLALELEMLLTSCRVKIKKKVYENLFGIVSYYQKELSENPEKVLNTFINQIDVYTTQVLNEGYWEVLDSLSKVRRALVNELSPLLHGLEDDKQTNIEGKYRK